MKIHVHDYLIDYLGGPERGDVCCGIDVFYSFSKEGADDDYLPSLIVYAGTPNGIGTYLAKSVEAGNIKTISFFRPLIVVREFDKAALFNFIKDRVESITGKTNNELLLRALEFFDLEEDSIRCDDKYKFLLYSK